ncbi:FAD-dependent monooxygenase [Streptomyces sp. NPDC004542]|uniref:FAD-dependent monooxygenase n=1 Tax=Streptomyces sp. NPDC004542 TaxID=3154281 RepID=UPI0033A7EF30
MNATTGTTRTVHRVLVVGSGPTGLLLAGDLATAGVPVTLVEKRPHRIGNRRTDRPAVARWAGDRRTTVLVRPGGYVAWAADAAGPEAVEVALAAHVG